MVVQSILSHSPNDQSILSTAENDQSILSWSFRIHAGQRAAPGRRKDRID
jgi:hypothetical protein